MHIYATILPLLLLYLLQINDSFSKLFFRIINTKVTSAPFLGLKLLYVKREVHVIMQIFYLRGYFRYIQFSHTQHFSIFLSFLVYFLTSSDKCTLQHSLQQFFSRGFDFLRNHKISTTPINFSHGLYLF